MKRHANKTLIHSLILFIVLIQLISCENSDSTPLSHSSSKTILGNERKKVPVDSFFSEFFLPITISEGKFTKAIGWLSDNEIVYEASIEKGNKLYQYDLTTGQNRQLFRAEDTIVRTYISPERKYILIHSAPSTFEGKITVISQKGEEMFSLNIPSVELEISWNPYQEESIIISAFKEDWTFTNYFLNVNNKKLTEMKIPNPFVKWIGEKKLAYLELDENDISLFAPLVEMTFGAKKKVLKENIFYFDTFKDQLFTITVNEDNQTGVYSFYFNNMKEFASFKAPILSNYSGWVVPKYEISGNQKYFLTMLPKKSAVSDEYQDSFQLISYHFEEKQVDVVLEMTNNVPFTCSPNGRNCLIGLQLEQIVQLHSKKSFQLIQ